MARRVFLTPQRLDMQALSAMLGISRATLYRWMNSRDDLHVEILWSLTAQWFGRTLSTTAVGEDIPLGAVLGRFVRDSTDLPAMQRFLGEEGDYAVRLLTLGEYGFQPRLVELVSGLVEQEMAAGRCTAIASADELAYAAVRVIEAFVHQRVIAARAPDADAATRVLVSLLR